MQAPKNVTAITSPSEKLRSRNRRRLTSGTRPRVPFFRFPGFGSSPELLAYLKQRGVGVCGADLWASDWNPMTPDEQLTLVLARLDHAGRGIILFHDTRAQTAKMLGKDEDAKRLEKASQNYKNMFDPETRLMRGRNEDGTVDITAAERGGDGPIDANGTVSVADGIVTANGSAWDASSAGGMG